MVDNSFWKNKKVLLTGHTGFKGSWLLFWLQAMGAKVIGYSLPPATNPNLFNLIHLNDDTHSYYGDVTDYDHLHKIIADEKPEIVLHLAAQALVRQSYANPMETYATNIMGTVHLLEALRKIACARVAVIVTSDKCYDNREWIWSYRETDSLGGYDPYSSSKGCVELITAAYGKSFFNNKDQQPLFIATARAGNVIGGGDWSEDRLIPDFVRASVEKKIMSIRHPNAIRPWQHVLEPLSGYLQLAQQLWNDGNQYAGAWNFGPNEEDAKSVEWIITKLIEQAKNGMSWKLDEQAHVHEACTLKLDISKARSKLKWKPRWNLETALGHTLDWYKSYYVNKDVQKIMVKQIYAFQQATEIHEKIY